MNQRNLTVSNISRVHFNLDSQIHQHAEQTAAAAHAVGAAIGGRPAIEVLRHVLCAGSTRTVGGAECGGAVIRRSDVGAGELFRWLAG